MFNNVVDVATSALIIRVLNLSLILILIMILIRNLILIMMSRGSQTKDSETMANGLLNLWLEVWVLGQDLVVSLQPRETMDETKS